MKESLDFCSVHEELDEEIKPSKKNKALAITLTHRFEIDVLRVLLLWHLMHSKGCTVTVNIVEHVGVLISAQPLVFPIKSQWLCHRKEFAETLLSYVHGIYPSCLHVSLTV